MTEYEIKDGVGIIPQGVKTVKDSAFKGREDLKSVVIPDSLQEICYSAFKNCTSLTSVIIPNQLEYI